MSDGFESYDAWKLRSPEDDYRLRRRPRRCLSCGEDCDGPCDECERELEEDVR